MLTGLFEGAALGLLIALAFIVRPDLSLAGRNLLEEVAGGNQRAIAWLALSLALFAGLIGALVLAA